MLTSGSLILDSYFVDAPIGQGGMGAVYAAHHALLGHRVAVKVLLPEFAALLQERFKREAQLLARVKHPNIAGIIEYGVTDLGIPVIVMDFIEGETLETILQRSKSLAWPTACELIYDVLRGLTALHGAHIIHRDMKPANVMLTFAVKSTSADVQGVPRTVKILDLGVAKSSLGTDSKLTGTGMALGTPDYMPPEQLFGQVIDERADLYATAIMLYELLTGEVPFGDVEGGFRRKVTEIIPAPRVPLGREPLPEALQALLMRALAFNPNHRPASAASMLASLEPILVAHRLAARTRSLRLEPAHIKLAPSEAARVDPAQPHPGGASADRARALSGKPLEVPVPPPTASHTLVDSPPDAETQEFVRGSSAGLTLVAARIPPSRLARIEERRWLSDALGAAGRDFVVPPNLWFALVQYAPVAETLKSMLEKRYGSVSRIALGAAPVTFSVTPSMLAGIAPFPDELAQLFMRLQGPG